MVDRYRLNLSLIFSEAVVFSVALAFLEKCLLLLSTLKVLFFNTVDKCYNALYLSKSLFVNAVLFQGSCIDITAISFNFVQLVCCDIYLLFYL